MPHNGAGVVLGMWSSKWAAIIVSPVLSVFEVFSRVWGMVLVVLLLLL